MSRIALLAAVLTVLVALCSRSFAQPVRLSPMDPAPAESGGAADGQAADASFDRGLFSTHGFTLRRGDITVDSDEIVLWQVKAGVTDWLQLSVGSLVFPGNWGRFGAKLAVYRSDRGAVAIHGTGIWLWSDDERLFAAMLGAAATRCLDPGCHSLITGGVATLGLSDFSDSDDGVHPERSWAGALTGAFVQRMSPGTKFFVEILVGISVMRDSLGTTVDAPGALAYGIHFPGRTWAARIAVLKPFGSLSYAGGLPWLSITYRR